MKKKDHHIDNSQSLFEIAYGLAMKFGRDGFAKAKTYIIQQYPGIDENDMKTAYELCAQLFDSAYKLGLLWHELPSAGQKESLEAVEKLIKLFPGLPVSICEKAWNDGWYQSR